jgi:hypothetical protein
MPVLDAEWALTSKFLSWHSVSPAPARSGREYLGFI